MIKAVKAGDWSSWSTATPVAGGVTLLEGEYELRLVAADAEHSAPLPGGEGVVVLDTAVTPELAAEGLARDVVRVVQQARRDAGLDVSDRITVVVAGAGRRGRGGRGQPGVRRRRDARRERDVRLAADVSAVGAGFTGEVGEGVPVRVAVARL